MRILHHTLNYPPDGNSTADLQGELGIELSRLGHDVTALTATPNANRDPEAEDGQPLTKRWLGLFYMSHVHGVRVVHASIPAKGSRVSGRIVDYLRFAFLSVIGGLRFAGGCDAVLVISPPLTIGISGWVLARLRRAAFVYVVQEIYPDIAVSLGVLKNRRVIALMERLERFVYRRADSVVVISPWFERRLRDKGVPPQRIATIPNFVDADFLNPAVHRQAGRVFRDLHGLGDAFVVMYAGNIGLTQSLETLLEASQLVRHLPDVRLLIVGGGTRYDWLKAELESAPTRYPNVLLLPYQPRSAVPAMYAASDVGLVPLKRGTARETFPSKVYTIMAAGKPAIVAADPDTELTWVVEQAGSGWAVPPDAAASLALAIAEAYHNRPHLPSMGARGRSYVKANHDRSAITSRYEEVMGQACAKRNPAAASLRHAVGPASIDVTDLTPNGTTANHSAYVS